MKQEKRAVHFVTYTGLGIAMILVAQFLGKAMPAGAVIAGPFSVSQLVTGSLVNAVLFVFTAYVGVSSGVLAGIISAVLASLIGVGPQVLVIVPLIAAGNVLLSVLFWLFAVKYIRIMPAAAVIAAVGKCAFLWGTVPLFIHAVGVPAQQAAMLSVMFSWPQGITALIGGVLALLILARLRNKNFG